jgi:acetylornithine/succinyldiaminopimelate/putrescine aminotransferase
MPSHQAADFFLQPLLLFVPVILCGPRLRSGRPWRPAIIRKAFEKGLLILGCGENSIRFCPAFTVTSKEIDLGLSIFEEAVKEVAH